MNKQLLLLALLGTFTTHESMEKPAKAHPLHTKYSAPINWQEFEQENLDDYTQEEVAPFLFSAVNNNASLKVVKKILDEKELSVNARDANGNLLLVQAILNQNTATATMLVRRNAKVVFEMDRPCYSGSNDEYPQTLTPWQAACVVGQEKYVRLLYEKMNPKDQQYARSGYMQLLKQFPIDYALIHKKPGLAHYLVSLDQYLLTAHYDYQRAANAANWPNALYLKKMYEQIPLMLNPDKDKLLSVTVHSSNLEGAKLLIEKGAKADEQLCAEAALQEDKPILDELCKTVKIKDIFPLRHCFSSTKLKSTRPLILLINAGADIQNQRPPHPPLMNLVASKYIDFSLKKSLIELFRTHGMRLDVQDQEGQTILHRTCGGRAQDEADDTFMFHLLDLGANADIPDNSGRTPFLLFCESNRNIEKLRRFLQTYNPSVNVTDCEGNTPLVHAANQGKKSLPLISLLMSHKADIVTSRDKMLINAFTTLNVELAYELVETHGALATHIDAEGKTNLMHVIAAHDFAHKGWQGSRETKIETARSKLIDFAVSHGVTIDAQDIKGKTALHRALSERRPSTELVEKLLSLGADPCIGDQDNITPLELSITGQSAFNGNTHITELLLNHTKGKQVVLSAGQTPIQYALSLNRTSMFDNGSWKQKLLDLFTRAH